MIHTQDIEEIISLSLASAYAANEDALSLMIVSEKVEMGKTEATDQFQGTPGVEFVGDLTAHGARRDLWKKINRGELRHIVIGEMLVPLSRASGKDSLIATMQLLSTDGAKAVHVGFSPIMPAGTIPRTVGFIFCLPRSTYIKYHSNWVMSGFLSRFVVASYTHDQVTVKAILESIRRGQYLSKKKIVLPFGKDDYNITIPDDVALACEKLGLDIVGTALPGYREVKHIRQLVKGEVILDIAINEATRREATMADFERVKKLDYLFGEKFNSLKPPEQERGDNDKEAVKG